MNRFEQRTHIDIVKYIRLVSPSTIVFHPANGGLRSKREAALMKAMGVLAGVWDLVLICEPPGPCLAFMEVKAPDGHLSPEQRTFRDLIGERNIPHAIVRSLGDVRAAFREWLVPVREVLPVRECLPLLRRSASWRA